MARAFGCWFPAKAQHHQHWRGSTTFTKYELCNSSRLCFMALFAKEGTVWILDNSNVRYGFCFVPAKYSSTSLSFFITLPSIDLKMSFSNISPRMDDFGLTSEIKMLPSSPMVIENFIDPLGAITFTSFLLMASSLDIGGLVSGIASLAAVQD